MSHGTLYSWPESGNSYKVRLLIALLSLDVKVVNLDFLHDEQHSPEYLKINPRGEVPCLVDGDKVFSDSSSILVWLAGNNILTILGVFTNRAILSYNGPYNGLGSNDKWTKERIDNLLEEGAIRGNQSLEILQDRLKDREWLTLDRVTIADLSVFVYIALAPMRDISLQPYPAVLAWIERVKGLKGFISIPGLDDPLVRRK
ncbi:hypothetical protein N0V90_013118 [Kalmusia sp. IMI 367209]|nr:hypothetical protein N0V90_013118 [Kalmusia sp. IMI 367209]